MVPGMLNCFSQRADGVVVTETFKADPVHLQYHVSWLNAPVQRNRTAVTTNSFIQLFTTTSDCFKGLHLQLITVLQSLNKQQLLTHLFDLVQYLLCAQNKYSAEIIVFLTHQTEMNSKCQ